MCPCRFTFKLSPGQATDEELGLRSFFTLGPKVRAARTIFFYYCTTCAHMKCYHIRMKLRVGTALGRYALVAANSVPWFSSRLPSSSCIVFCARACC